ncbi:hypothetical protein F0919_01810 [Taibaiella lutea]|uniref:Uncharacterized protein n=1 Tax=Taibaiella lutea TaxID=2608001 RepID=A0A5M6CMZ8_9BACT|nr:hypothetical protein [Taibaiella lutea]KAA5536427.1 hypothetical protein F0919_01810 [Taibaiella lutea]
MKKLLIALMAFIFMAPVSFGQQTTTTKKKTRAKTHTTARRTKKQPVKPADTSTSAAMRTPKSGMLTNGAGKTAKIQTTTKEKTDNLNDMDESRN